jgi:hypothetical protein
VRREVRRPATWQLADLTPSGRGCRRARAPDVIFHLGAQNDVRERWPSGARRARRRGGDDQHPARSRVGGRGAGGEQLHRRRHLRRRADPPGARGASRGPGGALYERSLGEVAALGGASDLGGWPTSRRNTTSGQFKPGRTRFAGTRSASGLPHRDHSGHGRADDVVEHYDAGSSRTVSKSRLATKAVTMALGTARCSPKTCRPSQAPG